MKPENLFELLTGGQQDGIDALEILKQEEDGCPYTLKNFMFCVTNGLLTDDDGVIGEIETPQDGKQEFRCNVSSFKDAYNKLKELEEDGKEVVIYWYAK